MPGTLVPRLALLGTIALAVLLGGCGRKGALDPPPRASAQPADAGQAAAPEAQRSQWPVPGQSVEGNEGDQLPLPKGERKSSPLDWLLN